MSPPPPPDQYTAARAPGYSADQIIQMEQRRKTEQSAPAAPAQQPTSLFGGLKQDLSSDYAARTQNIQDAKDAQARGEQGPLRTLFQIGGQAVGAGMDTVGDAISSVTPGFVKTGLSKLLSPVRKGIDAAADKFSNTKLIQEAAAGSDELPIERDIKAGQEYMSLVPGPKGVKAAASAAEKTAAAAAPAVRAATDATAAAASKIAKPVTAPFAKSYLPHVAQAFHEQGIVPPISAITKSPFLQGAEQVAAKSAFGRKIVDQVRAADAAIEKHTNMILDRIKPVKTISDENLGKTIQEGLSEYETHFKETQDKVYRDFEKDHGRLPAITANTVETLKAIVQDQGDDFFKGVAPRFSSMLDRLTGNTREAQALRKQMQDAGLPPETIESEIAKKQSQDSPALTFENLKATRTSVGEELAKDPENSALARLYGALSEDMNRTVSSGGNKKLADRLSEIAAGYKAGKDKIESRIASSIGQSNPERIAQNIITRNSAGTLKVLKEMIGQQRFEELSKTFLRQTLEGSFTRGKFDLDKLKGKLAEYDDATLKELLTDDQSYWLKDSIAKLERLQMLTDALKPGKKFSDGSQTAFLQEIKGTGTRAGAFLGALLAGSPHVAAGILLGTGAEASFARLFTSPRGRKLLTEGFGKTNEPKKLGDYLRGSGARSRTIKRPYNTSPANTPDISPTVSRDQPKRDIWPEQPPF
jgi:hypothetical protein